MLDFQRFDPARREEYIQYLQTAAHRGCLYDFANLNLWGRQRVAFVDGSMVILSHFDRKSVYSFPMGHADPAPAIQAIIADAKERGIPCCFIALTEADCRTLDKLCPGKFRFHIDRDSFDYIYDINDLADLKGRRYQAKRNHINRFRQNHPGCISRPMVKADLPAVQAMVDDWFAQRLEADPTQDFHLERLALDRAFGNMDYLDLEGFVLEEDGQILAMTMGSRLSDDTFDIHFEKARLDIDGAYPAINSAFAGYLREKYPQLRWLDREDDMGLEGLRKAKLSYHPARLLEKHWARLWEEDDEH